MIEHFMLSWIDDDGMLVESLYWITNGRCFCKYRIGGEERKAKRISERTYISAYDWYINA